MVKGTDNPKTSTRIHASPLLAKLHSLPIAQQTEYKVSSVCICIQMDRSVSHSGVSVIMQGEVAGTGGRTVVKYQIQTREMNRSLALKIQTTDLLTNREPSNSSEPGSYTHSCGSSLKTKLHCDERTAQTCSSNITRLPVIIPNTVLEHPHASVPA